VIGAESDQGSYQYQHDCTAKQSITGLLLTQYGH
jgi:hypothetical protein